MGSTGVSVCLGGKGHQLADRGPRIFGQLLGRIGLAVGNSRILLQNPLLNSGVVGFFRCLGIAARIGLRST